MEDRGDLNWILRTEWHWDSVSLETFDTGDRGRYDEDDDDAKRHTVLSVEIDPPNNGIEL
jgi:hypothetical protein